MGGRFTGQYGKHSVEELTGIQRTKDLEKMFVFRMGHENTRKGRRKQEKKKVEKRAQIRVATGGRS